jgi:hypothetical protein
LGLQVEAEHGTTDRNPSRLHRRECRNLMRGSTTLESIAFPSTGEADVYAFLSPSKADHRQILATSFASNAVRSAIRSTRILSPGV